MKRCINGSPATNHGAWPSGLIVMKWTTGSADQADKKINLIICLVLLKVFKLVTFVCSGSYAFQFLHEIAPAYPGTKTWKTVCTLSQRARRFNQWKCTAIFLHLEGSGRRSRGGDAMILLCLHLVIRIFLKVPPTSSRLFPKSFQCQRQVHTFQAVGTEISPPFRINQAARKLTYFSNLDQPYYSFTSHARFYCCSNDLSS